MRWHIVSSRSLVGLLAITTVLSVTPMAFGGTGPLAGGVVLQAEPEPQPEPDQDPDPDPDSGDGCPRPLGLTFVDQVGDVCNYTYETTDYVDATDTGETVESCPSPEGLTYVDLVGDVCNYTYETTDFVDATGTTTVSCPTPGGWTLVGRDPDTGLCDYTSVVTETEDATGTTVYSCDTVTGWTFVRREGSVCHYTSEGTEGTEATATVVYSCETVAGWTFVRRVEGVCHYTSEGIEGTEATATVVYTCPPAPATYAYSSRSGSTCTYTRSGTTTRAATASYTCPSAPSTYSYSGRSGSTCRYTRSTSTTRSATTSYVCPSAPSTYTYSGRSGSTCRYTRSTSTTRSASTSYTCPSAPSTYSYSGRSGSTCRYTRSTSTTRSASTSFVCPSAPFSFTFSRRVGSLCRYTRSTTTTRTASGHPSGGYNCPTAPATYSFSRRVGSTCYYTRSGSTTRTATTSYTCPSAPSTYSFSRRSGSTCYYTRSGSTTRTATTSYTCPSAPSTYSFSRRVGSTCHYTRSGSTTRAATTSYTCPSAPASYSFSRRSGSTCYYTRSGSTTRAATTSYTCPSAPFSFSLSRRVGSTCQYTRSASTTRTASSYIRWSCPHGYRFDTSSTGRNREPSDREHPNHDEGASGASGLAPNCIRTVQRPTTRPATTHTRWSCPHGYRFDTSSTGRNREPSDREHRNDEEGASGASGLAPNCIRTVQRPTTRPATTTTRWSCPTGYQLSTATTNTNSDSDTTPDCERTVTTPQTREPVTTTTWTCPTDRTINTNTSPPQCGKQITKPTTRPPTSETVWSCPTDRTINRSTSPPQCGKQITETTTLTATTATNTCPPTQLPTTTTRHYWTSNCPPQHRPNPNRNLYAKQYVLRNVTTGKNKIRVTSPTPFTLTWATLSATDTTGATTNINSTTGPVGNVIEWTPPGGTPDATVDYLIEISRTSTTTALLGYHTIQTSLLLQTPTGLTANGYNRTNPFAPALNIQWQQVPHARGYEIKYCKDTGNNCPDNVTTKQTYCVGTNCAASGVSQITPDTNGTFTAKIAKNTTTHSTLAIGQTYRIHIRAQDTQTGYQHHQTTWSHPVTTHTIKTAPSPPTGLRANGNSGGTSSASPSTASGVSVLNWSSSPTAKYYKVRYRECEDLVTCAEETNPDEWTTITDKITGTTHTINGLTLNQLYTVQVLAGNLAGESIWSNSSRTSVVLTYPTATRPTINNQFQVAGNTYRHALSSLPYAYKICTHNMTDTWTDEIQTAFGRWNTAMQGFTTPNGRTVTSTLTTQQSGQDCLDEDTRRVSLQTLTDVRMYCPSATAADWACAPILRDSRTQYAIYFIIGPTEPVWAGGRNCSARLEVTIHEIGHILGLNHPNTHANYTVMDTVSVDPDHKRVCEPQPMDIVAVKALYQSGSTP